MHVLSGSSGLLRCLHSVRLQRSRQVPQQFRPVSEVVRVGLSERLDRTLVRALLRSSDDLDLLDQWTEDLELDLNS